MCTLADRPTSSWRWSLACRQYKELVRRFGEGCLPENQEALLRDHLAECPDCRRIVRLLELDDGAIGAALLGPPTAGDRLESPRRLTRVLALTLALLLLVLAVLFVLYRQFVRHAGVEPGRRSEFHLDSAG